MEAATHRTKWKTLLAFAIIYFVWGSTFLAIRVGVREVPPFLLAAMRFLVAGLVLYGWMIAHGERSLTGRQWASASLLAILIFVLDYGLLFWAEQRVPSGIAAVMMATIPVLITSTALSGYLARSWARSWAANPKAGTGMPWAADSPSTTTRMVFGGLRIETRKLSGRRSKLLGRNQLTNSGFVRK